MTGDDVACAERASRERKAEANRRYRARQRGEDVPIRTNPYSAGELASLREAYEANVGNKGPWLERLALTLGRPKANLCRQARVLGLTDPKRRRGRKPRQRKLRFPTMGAAGRALWPGGKHPRGMLGKRHSPEARKRMTATRTGMRMPQRSQEARDAQSRAMVIRMKENPGSINLGKRGIGGRRPDLGGRYFRSRYEANYARYLNWRKVSWEYETKTFWFDGIKRGTRSYTPDFWVPSEGAFHEVKGWMDPKSMTKLARMRRYHPAVKVVIIDAKWFQAAERQGLCSLISGWECRHTAARQCEAAT